MYKEKTYSPWWYLLTAVMGFFLYPVIDNKAPDNPRKKHGVDTVYTKDSIYVIKFKIDTAFEQEPEEIEPKEQP